MTLDPGSRPAPRSASDLLVQCLEAEGWEFVFSVPGEETMDVLDALSRSTSIRHITTRHEQGAAFMADVHGRLTGRSAVAMVALTGPVPTTAFHKEAHQLVDVVSMLRPITKWNQRVEQVDAIPEIVRK